MSWLVISFFWHLHWLYYKNCYHHHHHHLLWYHHHDCWLWLWNHWWCCDDESEGGRKLCRRGHSWFGRWWNNVKIGRTKMSWLPSSCIQCLLPSLGLLQALWHSEAKQGWQVVKEKQRVGEERKRGTLIPISLVWQWKDVVIASCERQQMSEIFHLGKKIHWVSFRLSLYWWYKIHFLQQPQTLTHQKHLCLTLFINVNTCQAIKKKKIESLWRCFAQNWWQSEFRIHFEL